MKINTLQEFYSLFEQAVFTRKIDVDIPGAICAVSSENKHPIAIMWHWWGDKRTLKLKKIMIREILGDDIDLQSVQLLDRHGELLSKISDNELAFNLGQEPLYFIVSQNYDPTLAFQDNLSHVKVYATCSDSIHRKPLNVFEHLIRHAKIELFDSLKQLIKVVTILIKPIWY